MGKNLPSLLIIRTNWNLICHNFKWKIIEQQAPKQKINLGFHFTSKKNYMNYIVEFMKEFQLNPFVFAC